MPNRENQEIEQLRNQVAALERRVGALSIVLQASIVMTGDVLNRHKGDVIDLIGDYATKHPNPLTGAILQEWVEVLTRSA